MAFTKITPADTTGKGVIGLPDTPELSSTDMQEKFDELALDVIVPKFNNLVDEITDAFVEEGGDIADVAQALTDEVARAQGAEGDLSDAITTLDGAVMKKATYDSDNDGVVDNSELLNGHADSYFATAQSVSDLTTTVNGKMTRSTYDADNDGVVDNAEALGGHNASYFATASALSDEISRAQTAEGGKVDKVNGKGLSTNDYTDTDKAIVSGVTSALSGKVDKEEGKGLSTNDFTTAYKDQIGTNASNIGDLSSLVTTAKNNLVAAINEAASGGGASDLDDLTDVTISNPADGQVLKYNSASEKWENGAGGGGGASTMSDLTDTAIASPTTGQILQYSSVNKWTNVSLPSVGDLDDLSDVTISTPSSGQALVYSSVGQWVNGNVPKVTNGIVAWSGSTTCSITDDDISSDSIIEVFTENQSNTPLVPPNITISNHTVTLTFSALTEDTVFYLRISNVVKPTMINVTVENKGDYTGASTTIQMAVGSPAKSPQAVSPYYFAGYYTDASCTNRFSGVVQADLETLYARWSSTRVLTTSATAVYGSDTDIYYAGVRTDISDIKYNTTSVKTKFNITDGDMICTHSWTDAWTVGMTRTLTVYFLDASTETFTLTRA